MSMISVAVLTVAVLLALPASAGDDLKFTPRQLAHCVMHRVKDTPSESYKTAIKACKVELDAAANDKATQTAMNNAADRKGVK